MNCFCKNGILSQCMADACSEQASCRWYERSSISSRCMHRNEKISNHCGSIDAQRQGLVLSSDDDDTETIDLDSLIETLPEAIPNGITRSCKNCFEYPCAGYSHTSRNTPGGMSYGVMVQMAAGCVSYSYDGGE